MHRGVKERSADAEMHAVRCCSACRDLPRVHPGLNALSVREAEARVFKDDVERCDDTSNATDFEIKTAANKMAELESLRT